MKIRRYKKDSAFLVSRQAPLTTVWDVADAGEPGLPRGSTGHRASPSLPLSPASPGSLPGVCPLQCQREPEAPQTCFALISGCPSLQPPHHGSAGSCQPRHAGHACAPLVTAGEIHEIQTARKINLSFIFMMVMQQPSAAAFALQLHLSIAARSQLPAPRGAGGSVQPVRRLRSPQTHPPCGKRPAARQHLPRSGVGPTLQPSEPPSTSQAAAATAVGRGRAGTRRSTGTAAERGCLPG